MNKKFDMIKVKNSNTLIYKLILNEINSKIHFIGISGIGMSGIAELMLDKGYSIQGSDISVNDNTKRLKKKGIKFF